MKFKDIKINQRFHFIDDPKIYYKVSYGIARYEPTLQDSYVFGDIEVELVADSEKEDYEEVEKRSYWSYLVHQFNSRRGNLKC